MKRKLVIIGLFAIVMIGVLLTAINTSLHYRQSIIAAEGITKEVWVPDNCEVITTWAAWQEKFFRARPLFLGVPLETYKQLVTSETQNFVLITRDVRIIYYRSYQGKVILEAYAKINWPAGFNDAIDPVEYLGNGKIHMIVEKSMSGQVDAILMGAFIGLLVDSVIAILFVILLGNWVKRHREKPPVTLP
ncbi:MAG: hypothetical protein WC768_03050 [Patescibacteria group bacterium]|jgi:hypothetical protein